MKEERQPIGFVEATVRFPLYEGDRTDGDWDWFEFREPGINKNGELGTCVRKCEVIKAEVKTT